MDNHQEQINRNYFLQMIEQLRQNEEVMLYANVLEVSEQDADEVLVFLEYEYKVEARNFPFIAPVFDSKAAIWAAKTVYTAAQLMLYRQHTEADLNLLLPQYEAEITPSAMLSADLTLRFLPDMLTQLHLIDFEDTLIEILENLLHTWHYSGVNYALNNELLDFGIVQNSDCLKQLYTDRIIEYKNTQLAKNQIFTTEIKATLGIFTNQFWKEYTT